MQIRLYRTIDEAQSLLPHWQRLAGTMPLMGPAWLLTWWRHYHNARRRLWVVGAWQDDRLVGLAPWFLERLPLGRRAVRMLGSGEVCTDYLSVLLDGEIRGRVSAGMAEWLVAAARQRGDAPHGWDQLSFDAADAADPAIDALVHELRQRGALCWMRPAVNTWRLELPTTWDAYLAGVSKSHRKFIRRLDKNVLSTDRACWHTAGRTCSLDEAWKVLVDLHQQRRQSLGEPGCFASQRYSAFHRDVSRQLLDQGQLRLHWLALDGQPIAAEYHLAGGGIVYGYQSGLDPARLEEEPGRLAFICTLKGALADGFQAIDLMRGDEPYKAHWRAVPRPQLRIDLLPGRPLDRLWLALWQTAARVKQALTKHPPPGESSTAEPDSDQRQDPVQTVGSPSTSSAC